MVQYSIVQRANLGIPPAVDPAASRPHRNVGVYISKVTHKDCDGG